MTDQLKQPRASSQDRNSAKPQRPSRQKVLENLERWANSRELQPPKLPEGGDAP